MGGLVVALWGGSAIAADCTTRVATPDLVAALQRVESAYGALDTTSLFLAFEEVRSSIRCLDAALTEREAARVHRAHAITAFIRGDDTAAGAHMVASGYLEPGYRFPSQVVSEGHRLNRLLQAGDGREPPREAVPEAKGSLVFDGRVAPSRPLGVPTVFQWLDEGGVPRYSAYLYPNDPLPPYPVVVVETAAEAGDRPRSAWKRSPVPWVLGGVGAAATTGLLIGGGVVKSRFYTLDPDRYPSPAEYNADLRALKRSNNALVGGAAGAGALAAVGFSLGIAGSF
jgi:hypothetical protein